MVVLRFFSVSQTFNFGKFLLLIMFFFIGRVKMVRSTCVQGGDDIKSFRRSKGKVRIRLTLGLLRFLVLRDLYGA